MSIYHEKLYSLSEIRGRLPVRRCVRTLKRWAFDGATACAGKEKVKLEVVVVAGALHTSVEAVTRFLERLTRERFS
jgi:hypothetical protein